MQTSVPTTSAERLTEAFYRWELRGRGWDVYDQPVALEPPFRPVWVAQEGAPAVLDDGKRPTPVSRIAESIGRLFGSENPSVHPVATVGLCLEPLEPDPEIAVPEVDYVEFTLAVPGDALIGHEAATRLLLSLSHARRPISFEVIGTKHETRIQLACAEEDAPLCHESIEAFFPGCLVKRGSSYLCETLTEDEDRYVAVVDFGLSDEFMLPLKSSGSFAVDPLIEACAAMSGLEDDEVGLLQVLFAPVRNPWAREILHAVSDGRSGCFFADAPEVLALARSKVSTPLFAAVVRVSGVSKDLDRCAYITRRIGACLTQFTRPGSNQFIPLEDSGYPFDEHCNDVVARATHRTGAILSLDELVSLVHLPSASVQAPHLLRPTGKTKRAPEIAEGHELVLGQNVHEGESLSVTLSSDQRSRHMYVLGASGTGKSTLLQSLILQDIEAGEGVAVLDPHGDLIDEILGRIPEERLLDVVVFDPSDEDFPVPFNVLGAASEAEKNLLSSDLGAVFRRLATSWGDQMTAVLGNAILAFLESPEGGTLLELRRFLTEEGFRRSYLKNVSDPEVVYFWEHHFPTLSGRPQSSILTRLDAFLRPKVIRRMVAQKDRNLDFAGIMDSGKIFLGKLSAGLIGEENSHLLGSLLVSKFYQVAIGRQDKAPESRRDFWLYVDEFHHFVTPSMASILAGTRKYRLGMILAHQDLGQLAGAGSVGSSALANAYTRICFRLGDSDARKLANGFSYFDTGDLQSLPTGEAIARIEQAAYDFNLRVTPLPDVPPADSAARRAAVVAASRKQFATPREEVEEILARSQPLPADPGPPRKRRGKSSDRSHVSEQPLVGPSSTQTDRAPVPRRPAQIEPEPEQAGRGGRTHTYLQSFVTKAAQDRGFRAVIEEEILGGKGRVDVSLTRENERIACEISVTSTVDQELAHVRNALAAGYGQVVVVVADERQSDRTRPKFAAQLREDERDRVHVLSPAELVAHLDSIDARSEEALDQTIRGYRVNVRHKTGSAGELTARDAITKVVARSLRRMKNEE